MNTGGPRTDHRQLCRYGAECYQKNPMHHEKFRHPNERKDEDVKEEDPKKRKADPEPEVDQVDDGATPSQAKKQKVEEKEEEESKEESEPEKENDEPTKDEDKGEASTPLPTITEEVEEEEELLPASPLDVRENIKQKFLVEMPEDFYRFWEFCKERNHDAPEDALLDSCGLRLVGPFDIISGKLKKSNNRRPADYLCHWRFYYDVPEFQTVLANLETDFHLGYFRDDPKELPAFVASNNPNDNCRLTPVGDNLFGALYNHLTDLIRTAEPFKQTALQKLKSALHVFTTMKIQDHDFSLAARTQAMKTRDKKKQSATFHGAGMVVPYDKVNDVGYREIPETTASLKKIFKNIVEAGNQDSENKAMDVLHELITNVQFANDEGDPGMGLELGTDAFCFGGERLHGSIGHLMGVSYELMQREEYAKIIRAHLKRRREGQVFKIQ